ncbi:hypothetical protein ACOMHN_000487 [Nucella lapillus]
MPRIIETVVNCYSGDCSNCSEWSAETCAALGLPVSSGQEKVIDSVRRKTDYFQERNRNCENIAGRHKRDSRLRQLRVAGSCIVTAGKIRQTEGGGAASQGPPQLDHSYPANRKRRGRRRPLVGVVGSRGRRRPLVGVVGSRGKASLVGVVGPWGKASGVGGGVQAPGGGGRVQGP